MGRHDNPEFKPLHDRLMNLLRALLPLFNSMRGWNDENFDEGLAALEATVAKLKEQALQSTEPVFDFLPVVQDKPTIGDEFCNVENIKSSIVFGLLKMENDQDATSEKQLNQMSNSVGTLMELIAGMHLLNFDLFKSGVEDVQNLVDKLREIEAVNNNNNNNGEA